MTTARVERRLAAILAADVVGYSRLMGENEAGTLARLKAHRKELIEPLLTEHRGRVVKLIGDGVLCEFASVVDAVGCAIAIQQGMTGRERDVPEAERIRFRIGINTGDIIIDEEDIYGDGVNVAARLEGLAEPGGICVSGRVREEIARKLAVSFASMGAQRVKNIAEPVEAWRVVLNGRASVARFVGWHRGWRRRWASPVIAGLLALLIVGASVIAWLSPWRTGTDISSPVRSLPTLALDKRRVAVLPFTNMSADVENEYFSDGMTEELISKLSRLHDLTVIARTSVMQYKKTAKGIAEIGRELQAGTILEGSVRKAGARLRITAQLIDVASQAHLWSENYDRDQADVFAIQSDVARHVVHALQITLNPAEAKQIAKAGTGDLDAYNAYLKGLYHYNTWSKQGLEKSIEYFKQAIARDPNFAKAYAAMAFAYEIQGEFGYLPPREAFPKVKEAAHRALEIDAATAEAHTVLAVAAGSYDHEWTRAEASYRRALELNPNSAVAHDWYGILYLAVMGRYDEAIAHGKRAKELDPLTAYMRSDLGHSYIFARRYDEAIAECQEALEIAPTFYFTYWCLGLANLKKGLYKEAIAAYERAIELEPEDLRVKADLSIVYAVMGQKDRAQQIFEEFEEKARREHVPAIVLTWAHMAVGDLDGTFDGFNKMYEERDPELVLMNVHPRYYGLRDDPRFQQLLRKIGFKES